MVYFFCQTAVIDAVDNRAVSTHRLDAVVDADSGYVFGYESILAVPEQVARKCLALGAFATTSTKRTNRLMRLLFPTPPLPNDNTYTFNVETQVSVHINRNI